MRAYAKEFDRTAQKLCTQETAYYESRIVNGPDGKPIPDKSAAKNSRPEAKRTIRNAKRAQKKKTRQRLKQEQSMDL